MKIILKNFISNFYMIPYIILIYLVDRPLQCIVEIHNTAIYDFNMEIKKKCKEPKRSQFP